MADIASSSWHEDDNANSEAAPLGSPENMAPSGVNNVLRAHQGAIKRFWKRSTVMFAGGTASAYLVTHTVPPEIFQHGETELVQFHVANNAAATLNVGGLGDRPLHYYSVGVWRLVPPGLVGAEEIHRVSYHAGSGAYRIIDLPDRTGEIVPFAGINAPAGTLLCYGQAVSRTSYPGLIAAFGTTYGVGDGSSTFNLPDLRGRAAAGKGDMGGSESGRLNGQIASILGAAGGEQEQFYAVGGSVTGSGTISGTAHTSGLTTTFVIGGGDTQQAANQSGMDLAGNRHWHEINANATVDGSCTITSGSFSGTTNTKSNVQPTMELNYIIRI